MTPRVSIALATYNGERFLQDQLDSISTQTRAPDQLVISDDASTDGTFTIAERFADEAPFQVAVHRNAQRLGWVENFFRAIALCRGDAIALCDQDDVWHPDKLSTCLQALEAEASISMVVHAGQVVDESLRPTGELHPRIRRRRVLPPGALRPFASFPGFSLVFRASLVASAGIEDRPPSPDFDRMTPDGWVSMVGGAFGAVALLPESLVMYRRHATNTGGRVIRESRVRRARRSLELGEEEAYFAGAALAAKQCASYLEHVADRRQEQSTNPSIGASLTQTVARYRRFERAMERRATLYAERGRFRRAGRLAAHALRGDYARRSAGGLGVASAGRDLGAGVIRRPRSGALDRT